MERLKIVLVARAGHHGDVERCAAPGAFADFPVVSGAGVAGAGMLVDADKQNRGVILERRLRAVAVMNVEIDDGDRADAVAFLQISRGNRCNRLDLGVEIWFAELLCFRARLTARPLLSESRGRFHRRAL